MRYIETVSQNIENCLPPHAVKAWRYFFTSRVTSITRPLLCLFRSCWVRWVSTITWIAETVEWPFLKPCCLGDNPSVDSTLVMSRALRMLSSSFPAVYNLHRGLYAEDVVESPLPLLMNTRRYTFQDFGKVRLPSISFYLYKQIRKCNYEILD